MLERGARRPVGNAQPHYLPLGYLSNLGHALNSLSLSFHTCKMEMHKCPQQAGLLGRLEIICDKRDHSANTICFS